MLINRPGDLTALNGLSHLDDPLRRQLYEYVIESDGPVSREQAAAAASIGRTLAGPAGYLWSSHHLLQSLRSLAAGWRLGPDHGCTCRQS